MTGDGGIVFAEKGVLGGGRSGPTRTERVMSHDAKRICLVYGINLASAGGPSARTIIPHSPVCPHLPGPSPS